MTTSNQLRRDRDPLYTYFHGMAIDAQWTGNRQSAQTQPHCFVDRRACKTAENACETLEADRTRFTVLHALESEEIATLRELRDVSSTLADDLQATRADASLLNVELSDEKSVRPAAETRVTNVPASSIRSGEALARLKTDLARLKVLFAD